MAKNPNQMTLYLKQSEREVIGAAARKIGLSMSSFLRSLALRKISEEPSQNAVSN